MISAGHKTPRPLRNVEVHHRAHKSPILDPITSQANPVHTPAPYFSEILFNATGLLLSSRFPTTIFNALPLFCMGVKLGLSREGRTRTEGV